MDVFTHPEDYTSLLPQKATTVNPSLSISIVNEYENQKPSTQNKDFLTTVIPYEYEKTTNLDQDYLTTKQKTTSQEVSTTGKPIEAQSIPNEEETTNPKPQKSKGVSNMVNYSLIGMFFLLSYV